MARRRRPWAASLGPAGSSSRLPVQVPAAPRVPMHLPLSSQRTGAAETVGNTGSGGGQGTPRVTAGPGLPCTTEVGPAGRRHIVPIPRLAVTGRMRSPHPQTCAPAIARVPTHGCARQRARAGDHTGGGRHPERSPPARRPARQEDLGRAISVCAASADRRTPGGDRRNRLTGHPGCGAGGNLPGGVPEKLNHGERARRRRDECCHGFMGGGVCLLY